MTSTPLIDIFLENLGQAMVFPVGRSVSFEAMYWFGQTDALSVLMMLSGAVLGCMTNWAFGQFLAYIRMRKAEFFSDARFNKLGTYVRRYAILVLPFYWIPLGGIFMVAAGFFNLRWWHVMALALVGGVVELALYFPLVLG